MLFERIAVVIPAILILAGLLFAYTAEAIGVFVGIENVIIISIYPDFPLAVP